MKKIIKLVSVFFAFACLMFVVTSCDSDGTPTNNAPETDEIEEAPNYDF